MLYLSHTHFLRRARLNDLAPVSLHLRIAKSCLTYLPPPLGQKIPRMELVARSIDFLKNGAESQNILRVILKFLSINHKRVWS